MKAAIALLMLSTLTAQAEFTAHEFYDNCETGMQRGNRDPEIESDYFYCLGYLRGTVTFMNEINKQSTGHYCVPNDLTNLDLISIYLLNAPRYLASYPQLKDQPPQVVVTAVFGNKFECK
jgi:hypothetical protein